MKLSLKNTWITINILLAASMVYLAFTKGFAGVTNLIVAITHLSVLLYYFYSKGTFKKVRLRTRSINSVLITTLTY
ncbi:MAG: hypothetical protein H3C54_11225, partial [Taibaiella sp.]|nr:hypothetical protein [Taibaiella sp.]